ncbi:MAG: IS21 family transposase [Bacteroidales bacterium]|nr:IS21 family transposase [Bacteroidales bacterium]
MVKRQKKVIMWYKIKELEKAGLNKTQIGKEIGIHRKTVRGYLRLSEEEFYKKLEEVKLLPKKLQEYYEYVRELLERYPYISASQVEDRLKENYSKLPQVHSKTVYNFVESIRKRHDIKKQKDKAPRQYEKLAETEYGEYGQVDFGEYQMLTQGSGRKKIHFFVMVLSRSRQKYVYFQTVPFTTKAVVKAHERGFRYFGGQVEKIIYDQDRVLIVEENLGDIILTQEFRSYIDEIGYKPIFCRKSDPESKGKVENVIKYIKNNFLRGRIYIGEEELNRSALMWLERTGNGKEHAGTKKIPNEEWEIERKYLRPLKPMPTNFEDEKLPIYKVRKDNTISYKSNFYTLPQGTYKGSETWVLLKETEDKVRIYDINKDLLTIHQKSYERGKTVRNTDHTRDKSQSMTVLKENVLQMFSDKIKGRVYIEQVEKEKPRYLRDNLLVMQKHLPGNEMQYIMQALDFCLENGVYNSMRMIEIMKHYKKEAEKEKKVYEVISDNAAKTYYDAELYTPQKSKLSIYETIL